MIQGVIPLLRVSNAAVAQAFYCHGLGFQLEFVQRADINNEDPCYMGVSRNGVWVHLSSYPSDGTRGSVVNVIVDNLDELHAEFAKRKVPIDTPPVDQNWGSREMYVKDTDKNCLRFIQPAVKEEE